MKKTITAAGDDPSGRWRAARYLVRGRPHWDNCWVDLSVQNDPRVWLEGRLGQRVEDFELIPGIAPMTMRQMLDGEGFRVPLPVKPRSMRKSEQRMVLQ